MLSREGDQLVALVRDTGIGIPADRHAHIFESFRQGEMGLSRSYAGLGLGLALAQAKRRVLVITGDGEMLMGLGALATVAVKRPDNLAILVIDNEHYGETGMQCTHTSTAVELAGVALACGFRWSTTVRQTRELDDAVPTLHTAKGPILVVLKVSATRDPLVLPPWDGALLKSRFRQALLGAQVA